jgi:2'-5' RNA ligase
MQKRVFSAIGLPEDIKKRLFRFVEKEYPSLPVRWVRLENFHLTLEFLGYVPDENIPDICEAVRSATQNLQPFELNFEKIEAGPNSETKKMIWVTGEKSEELSNLKYQLDKALGFRPGEKREFRPHITLGRIRKEKWKKISPEPDVSRDFKFSVPVNSIELYESKFEKGKRVYYVLESFPLK